MHEKKLYIIGVVIPSNPNATSESQRRQINEAVATMETEGIIVSPIACLNTTVSEGEYKISGTFIEGLKPLSNDAVFADTLVTELIDGGVVDPENDLRPVIIPIKNLPTHKANELPEGKREGTAYFYSVN